MCMKDRVWFLCLVIWLGPGDRHSVADYTAEHAMSGTERRVSAVGWTSVERVSSANDMVAVLAKHDRGNEDDFPVTEYMVSITNNGPVILGSSATFVATVRANPSIEKNANGIRLFTWTGPIPVFLPQYIFGNDSCTIEIPFDKNKIKPGEVTIKVTVREILGFGKLVGEANSSIKVTDTINGDISMSSSAYPECNNSNPSCSIPTKTNLTLEAELHDPGDFFEGALFLYKWNMGDGVSTKELREPFITYNYSMKGEYNVTVIIVTEWKGTKYNTTWWRTIKVLDAITNLTIASQSSSVQVGNNVTVNLTCNGSLPVELCLTVDEPSTEWSNQTNTTCETVLSGTCGKSFVYNFKSSGKYTFQAAASNNVSFAVSVSTIHAHDPQPPLPPQSITAITVAIIAGLSMTCFGVVSFLQHVRKNRERHIEVANFDFQFQEHSNSFGKLRTSIFSWKRGSEKESLMNNSSSNFYSL